MGDLLDEYGIEEDPRYKTAHREAKIGIVLSLFYVIWWAIFGLGLGMRSPENYTFILGFPDWFFLGPILGWVLLVILVIFSVRKFYNKVPLDSKPEREVGEEKFGAESNEGE